MPPYHVKTLPCALLSAEEPGPHPTPAPAVLFLILPSVCFRIYNNLPEVKKKREEQKKRVILQSNRLRAEVFKKVARLAHAGVTRVVRRKGELDIFVSVVPPAITGPAPSEKCRLIPGGPASHSLDLGRCPTLDEPLNLTLSSHVKDTFILLFFFFLKDPSKQKQQSWSQQISSWLLGLLLLRTCQTYHSTPFLIIIILTCEFYPLLLKFPVYHVHPSRKALYIQVCLDVGGFLWGAVLFYEIFEKQKSIIF